VDDRKKRNIETTKKKKHVDLLRCSSLMAMWTTGLGLKRENTHISHWLAHGVAAGADWS